MGIDSIWGTVINTVGASRAGQVSSAWRRAFAVRSTAPLLVMLVPIKTAAPLQDQLSMSCIATRIYFKILKLSRGRCYFFTKLFSVEKGTI